MGFCQGGVLYKGSGVQGTTHSATCPWLHVACTHRVCGVLAQLLVAGTDNSGPFLPPPAAAALQGGANSYNSQKLAGWLWWAYNENSMDT